ncbi:MAG TPA: alpha-amylase family glycosyl hydrolase [Candidatus Ozemobacteraceae bacterium]
MRPWHIALLVGIWFLAGTRLAAESPSREAMNEHDHAREQELAERAADWRNGPVVYQIIVDRFAPSTRLAGKKSLYAAPRRLRDWKETPQKGSYLEKAGVWSHEVDFWGGDLESLRGKLDYLQELGVDVVYLNPVFSSLTNHKYDAWDYHVVDPVYGSRKDLADLAAELHRRGQRLVLDGVFNHMGLRSPMFQEARRDPHSRWRPFFKFSEKNDRKYIGWYDVENLPELNMENPDVQAFIYAAPDSVVQSYLRNEEIDGWRLDVAFDLGFRYLTDLTRAAHTAKPGSLIIGEIWNYPEEWHPAVDGVMNMHGRKLLLTMLEGRLSGPLCSQMWETSIDDAGMDHILKSWLVLDNHDTPRLANLLPQRWQQEMARILQFTLPGAVCLYYGSELGMTGGDDPEQRAPMRWDLVTPGNPMLALHRRLLALRRAEPALRYGDFRRLHSEKLFAFLRRTNSVRDTVVVIANPTGRTVKELLQVRDSKLQDVTPMLDQLSDRKFMVFSGTIDVEVPAHTVLLLKADTADYPHGYNRYDRIY